MNLPSRPGWKQIGRQAIRALAVVSIAAVGCTEPSRSRAGVRPGIEVLATDSVHLVLGRRVGLITNHTGVTREGRQSAEALMGAGVEVVALFGPEHGFGGLEKGGDAIADAADATTGLPIYSLYGDRRAPDPAALSELDVLVFDIQDIGARYYTYVATMAAAMEAAAEAGIRFVVADRPNPIGGYLVQGSVLDPAFASFVGPYPIPMRHGMTAGELALLINVEHGVGADLHVVPAAGWNRRTWADETGIPWVATSPNMPTLESAAHYPGTCLFEGTNLSVGRGTDRAFQQIGAPWLDAPALVSALAAHELGGVRVEAVRFTPVAPDDGKYDGQVVQGVHLSVTNREAFDPTRLAVVLLSEIHRLAGDRWQWRIASFDRLAGTDRLRLDIDAGVSVDSIVRAWTEARDRFIIVRAEYLLYR